MKCIDINLIRQLLTIAHEANPPDTHDDWNDVAFDHPSGWKVVIFYDAGDLDYIDSFISPAGERFDLWAKDLDPRLADLDSDGWLASTLQCWRGVNDTARLLEGLKT